MFSLEELVRIGLEVVRGYELDPHGTHGIRHWGRVLDNATGLALLKEARATHTGGRGPADITIHTCRDADRLDLPRVGMDTRIDWLCTAPAREDSFYRPAVIRGGN